MSRYIEPTEQLVVEILVKDIKRSTRFYCQLGFAILRDGGDFVELTWEDHRLFLAELSAFHEAGPIESSALSKFPAANIRVMVPNVDKYWRLAVDISARIIIPIADRYYGLRDFTIADPDGFGIRFASELINRSTHSSA
jgi:catechol 2,3-dioxygenase-like lactoylglutathione lyase family enzyme